MVPAALSALGIIAGISVTIYFIWGINQNNEYTNDNGNKIDFDLNQRILMKQHLNKFQKQQQNTQPARLLQQNLQ